MVDLTGFLYTLEEEINLVSGETFLCRFGHFCGQLSFSSTKL